MFNTYPNGFNNFAPQQKIADVYGREGALAYPMGPNSSALLRDITQPIIWAKKTDSAGYPTVIPLDYKEHKDQSSTELSAYATKDDLQEVKDLVNGMGEKLEKINTFMEQFNE